MTKTISYLDSHTGGEPTRLFTQLPFALTPGTSVREKRAELQTCHDGFRQMAIGEPRGSDVLVGCCLVEAKDPSCQFGIIFFNNVGYLGMCGHGLIGAIASLSYLGRLQPGLVRVESPVGIVEAHLLPATESDGYPNRVSFANVPAYRHRQGVAVRVDGQLIHGDVAWGGNWFFLVHDHGLTVAPENLPALERFALQTKQALNEQDIKGRDGQEVDHIELFGPSTEADSRSFVLCPGGAYDRSPCGTGTSAKLACLYADGRLAVGQTWRQQSIIGSIFEGSVAISGTDLIPTITGEAWVMNRGELLVDPRDPFANGIVNTGKGGR